MRLCQQQDKVETLLFMSIPSPGFWPQDSDNERVGWRSGRVVVGGSRGTSRRDRQRERMGGDGQTCPFWSNQVSVLFDEDEVKC